MSVYKEYKGTVWTVLIIAFSVFVYLNTGYTMYDADDLTTVEAAFDTTYELEQLNSRTEKSALTFIPGTSVRARLYNVSSMERQAGMMIAMTNTDTGAKSHVLSDQDRSDISSVKTGENTYLFHTVVEERQPEQGKYHRVSTYQDGIVVSIMFPNGVEKRRGETIASDLRTTLTKASEDLDQPIIVLRPVITGILGSQR